MFRTRKGPYDRYRSGRSRNELGGGQHAFEPSLTAFQKSTTKAGNGAKWSQSRTKAWGHRGSQPITTEVGTRVGIAECASQSDVRERVGAAESSIAKPAGTVVSQ